MKTRIKFVVVLAIAITALIERADSKVARTSLSELTTTADQIVVGRVVAVNSVEGLRVATLEVHKTLKGPSFGHVHFLAHPTWTCDISTAKVGENVLLFLNKYTFGSGGKDPLDFKEPRAFREKIADLTGTNPFFAITWSGRGRMPLRIVDGIEYATLWTADVSLPATLVSIDGPEKEYSSFIRSARLSDVLAAVKTQIAQNSHKAGAQGR